MLGFLDFVGILLSFVHEIFSLPLVVVADLPGSSSDLSITLGNVITATIILPAALMLFMPSIRRA